MTTQKPDIIIQHFDESYVKVLCKEAYMEHEIQDKFSFEVPNAKHDPRVKKGHWDGIKKLYNRRRKTLHYGLLLDLLEFIQRMEYSFVIDDSLIPEESISMDDIKHVVHEVIQPHDNGVPIEPYESQYAGIHFMLNMNRTLCLSSTSSGKSLIIYCVLRILQFVPELDSKKFFVVVPSAYLVEQMFDDFKNYANGSDVAWNVDRHCQKVNADYSKDIQKKIVITTWQSMQDFPRYVLDDMGAMIVDEVHGAKADVLGKLIDDSRSCKIKHGLTGSLNGFESDEMYIQGLFGPRKVLMTARESIEKGMATDIKIVMPILKYPDIVKKQMTHDIYNSKDVKKWYRIEKDFMHTLEMKHNFIRDLAMGVDGNVLILFDTCDDYQIPVYEKIKDVNDHTFVVNKDVNNTKRKEIKDFIENISPDEKVILCATYGTMSTGVSIKNLHSCILASSTKSLIKIVQTIGRLMRKHKSKELAIIYDVADDFDYGDYKSYTLKHAKQRISIYVAEKHKIEFVEVDVLP